jgi:cob(I)alamin adenosyltransferase
MGYRLTRIYTRKGDKGKTRLGEGTSVSKDDFRVEAYGNVDELNSMIGLLRSYNLTKRIELALEEVQHGLFDLGGELSIPGHSILRSDQVKHLEAFIDELNEDLAPLEEFILPGGSRAAAICHVARTVCRRAERSLVALSQTQKLSELAISYLNRLSDLLFVMARAINRDSGVSDVLWNRDSPE